MNDPGISQLPRDACQHCHREVSWSARPSDAGYGAMVHTKTNRVNCER